MSITFDSEFETTYEIQNMTVADLIKFLKKLPQDAMVLYEYDGTQAAIAYVKLNKIQNEVIF